MRTRATTCRVCWSLLLAFLFGGCHQSGPGTTTPVASGGGNSGSGGAFSTGGTRVTAMGGANTGATTTASGGNRGSTTDVGKGGQAGGMSSNGGVSTGGAGPRGGSAGVATGSGGFGGGGTTTGAGGKTGGQGGGAGGAGSGGADASVPTTSTPGPQAYNGRRGRDFNSGWKFNRGDVTGAEQTSFSDSAWKSVDVPHDWSIELAFNSNSPAGSGGGYLDGGIGWYRKTFTLDSSWSGQRIFIAFDGVYMNSQVWINGSSLGTRPYGYSTFEYEITDKVKTDGTANVVAVKVNNNQPNSRWYSGSGIYRNVWLTRFNPVHIPQSGVFVSTPAVSAGSATVSVGTDVQNQSSASTSVSISTTITDATGAVVASNDSPATSIAAGAQSTFQQSITVSSPKLWSTISPVLYQVKVDVTVGGATVDTYLAPLGFRTLAFDANKGFSLNGVGMKLRGVCMHHDLGALGAAINYRAIERQVEILKGMGVNAIRTSHNPPAPELLDIADRLGVMILDEAFDTWTQTKTANDYGKYFNDWAQRDLQDMVRRDRNHPSVIMWSIGNEVGGATTTTAQNLKNWVLALDKTRPVTWASNKMGGPHVSEGDDRNVAKLLDLVGYNYAPYAGDYDADHASNPSWKIFGSETNSALSSRGVYHTPAATVVHSNDGTSDKQCSSYDNRAARYGFTAREAYAYDNSRPFSAGSFAWTGFDYGGEPTPNGWPAKSSYSGIVDTAGFPKDSYYFQQSRWTSEPMVHILPHWNWTSGTTVTVYAYSNCDSVELFLNDESQGSKTLSGSALNYEWNVPWASGTLRADCKRAGTVAATDTVKTAGAAAKIALSADRTSIHADGRDMVFITADIQDSSGIFVPTGNASISWSVSGPGSLVGLDNGDPTDTTSYKGTSRKAFNGKALAMVRATTSAGTITIKATASGLTADSISVTAQ